MNREKLTNGWRRFLNWSGWTAWLHWKGWRAMARWKGWTAWLRWPVWNAIGSWKGWRPLLFPDPRVVGLLGILSAAGLTWVFAYRQDTNPLAYLFYCIAFYALLTACLQMPATVRACRSAFEKNTLAQKYAHTSIQRFRLKLYLDQFINLLYGFFKIAYGYLSASFWIAADGLYNLVQGIIQLAVILRRRNDPDPAVQWKTYRFCGALTLVMALPIAGMVWLAISAGAHKEYPGYLIFITALFAFYKLPSAFVRVAKDRRHSAPLDSAVRLLKLSQALFSMFSLQAAMIFQFGGSPDFAALMNTLTGSAVCLLVTGMGIYMLHRGRRDLNLYLQENHHE